jgi:hypothetical protein
MDAPIVSTASSTDDWTSTAGWPRGRNAAPVGRDLATALTASSQLAADEAMIEGQILGDSQL